MTLQFPNVPYLPGVPTVARSINTILSTPQILLSADVIGNILSIFQPQWGIFDINGNPLLLGDSVMSIGSGLEYKVSDYVVEGGGFESYNKVAIPYDAKITFGIGRSVANRATFLATVDSLVRSVALVNVATPEATYINANVIKRSYERVRSNGGRSLIYVDVLVREIRIAATSTFTNTVNPSAQDPTVNGTTQPTDQNPPPNPDSTTTPTPTAPLTTTPTTQTNQTGVVGNSSSSTSDTGYAQVTPQTAPDGSTTNVITVNNVAASDPILQRTDLEANTAYKNADGTYNVSYIQSSSPPALNNQTIPDTSPNKGVAS